MKKKLLIGGLVIIGIAIFISIGYFVADKNNNTKENNSNDNLKELPLPEVTGGTRGELGIDKNINEKTIDDYLNRSDSVYRDMRMLDDPGDYESIGGDSKLSGYVKGFEVIPLPYIIPVSGLPESVGNTYQGETLFSLDSNGKYVANYEESMSIIEEYFPKDKYIFLMCGGGGYAGMTKNFLVSLGWDTNKIYNVGGYWYYDGKNNVEVKKVTDKGITYDFDSVPYIDIDFTKLHKLKNSNSNQNSNSNSNILVTDVKLNKTSLSLKVGETYTLIASVQPSSATDKSVTWTSSNTDVANVSASGKITAQKAGTTTITVSTKDGNKKATCKVTIKPKTTTNYVKLDNISNEVSKFNKFSPDIVSKKFYSYVNDSNGRIKDMYYDENGNVNDLWKKEYDKYEKELEKYISERVSILNTLSNKKKSFVILLADADCYAKPFSLIESTKKILKANGISYFYIEVRSDTTFDKSKLYYKNRYAGSVIIVNKGKVYAYTDPNKNSFHNDNEVKKWLKKYINIK